MKELFFHRRAPLVLLSLGYLLHQTRGMYSESNLFLLPLIAFLCLPLFQSLPKTDPEKQFLILTLVFGVTSAIAPRILYTERYFFLYLSRALFFGGTVLITLSYLKKWPLKFYGLSSGLYLLGLLFIVFASPNPFIDVWTTGQEAVSALLSGTNPYTVSYRQIYDKLYPYEVFYGYPPLPLLLYVPFILIFGDVRFGWVLVLGLTAFGLYKLARKSGHSAESSALLASSFLVFPVLSFIVEQAFIDPFSGLVLVAMAYAIQSDHPKSFLFNGVLLGLWISFKPTNWLVAPLLIWLSIRRFGYKSAFSQALLALALNSLINLPFYFWNPTAFVERVLWFTGSNALTGNSPMTLYPRMDSLSFLVWFVHLGWTSIPKFLPNGVLLLSSSLVFLWTLRDFHPAKIFWGLSFIYITYFAFSQWAFCNYYWFAALGIWIASTAPAKDLASKSEQST